MYLVHDLEASPAEIFALYVILMYNNLLIMADNRFNMTPDTNTAELMAEGEEILRSITAELVEEGVYASPATAIDAVQAQRVINTDQPLSKRELKREKKVQKRVRTYMADPENKANFELEQGLGVLLTQEGDAAFLSVARTAAEMDIAQANTRRLIGIANSLLVATCATVVIIYALSSDNDETYPLTPGNPGELVYDDYRPYNETDATKANIGKISVGQEVCTVPRAVSKIRGYGTVMDGSYDYNKKGGGTMQMRVKRTKKGFKIVTPEAVSKDNSVPGDKATISNLVPIINVKHASKTGCPR